MSIEQLKAKAFEDKDKEKLVELLNLIHVKISNLNGKEAFEYFKLMQWAQQVLLVKVNQNIMGEMKVHEAPLPEKKATKKAK